MDNNNKEWVYEQALAWLNEHKPAMSLQDEVIMLHDDIDTLQNFVRAIRGYLENDTLEPSMLHELKCACDFILEYTGSKGQAS